MGCRHCFHWNEAGEECCECSHLVEHKPNLANKAITRIRELHYKYDAGCSCCDSRQYECAHCLTDYPCPTIKALDGEQ